MSTYLIHIFFKHIVRFHGLEFGEKERRMEKLMIKMI